MLDSNIAKSELSLPEISQGRSNRPINLDLTMEGMKRKPGKAPLPFGRGRSSNNSIKFKQQRKSQQRVGETDGDIPIDLISIDED